MGLDPSPKKVGMDDMANKELTCGNKNLEKHFETWGSH